MKMDFGYGHAVNAALSLGNQAVYGLYIIPHLGRELQMGENMGNIM